MAAAFVRSLAGECVYVYGKPNGPLWSDQGETRLEAAVINWLEVQWTGFANDFPAEVQGLRCGAMTWSEQ